MKKAIVQSMLVLGAAGMLAVAQTYPQTAPQTHGTTGSMSDTQMSSQIRQAIMNDQNAQSVAHNVRVTAHNGTVTLKGKVNSTEEKDAIVKDAKQIAGDANVKDEITVAKK
jgi:osmotically-inducible protein OsmY